jgi:hypothetical protein
VLGVVDQVTLMISAPSDSSRTTNSGSQGRLRRAALSFSVTAFGVPLGALGLAHRLDEVARDLSVGLPAANAKRILVGLPAKVRECRLAP